MGVWDCLRTGSGTEKSLPMARHSVGSVGAPQLSATPTGTIFRRRRVGSGIRFSKADPYHHTQLFGVKCTQSVESRNRTDSFSYILKWVVHENLRRRVRVAGKPSDEPLRKGETQSPTDPDPRL
jgi:hypothetical protein